MAALQIRMIGMPYTGEFAQHRMGRIEVVELEFADIVRKHAPVPGMHGATVRVIPRHGFGVILERGIDQGTARVHNARDTAAAEVRVRRVFQANGVTVFVRRSC